jgi:AmiR/NasT family two-component response regulator
MIVVAGAILVVGFFFAAQQHFSSIDYGIKNSRLRKQIDELEAEKRRLLLAKEVSLSPSEIKKAARKMGFMRMTAANIETGLPTKRAEVKPAATLAESQNPIEDRSAGTRFVKTVLSAPIAALSGKDSVETTKKVKSL